MQIFTVSTQSESINFFPLNVYEEIIQNVRTILTTPKYSVPLDRNFGLSATVLDNPVPQVQARLTTEIIAAIQKYESRVVVVKVLYEANKMDGLIYPKVQVKIRES